jgi:hypothetical protein
LKMPDLSTIEIQSHTPYSRSRFPFPHIPIVPICLDQPLESCIATKKYNISVACLAYIAASKKKRKKRKKERERKV